MMEFFSMLGLVYFTVFTPLIVSKIIDLMDAKTKYYNSITVEGKLK